MNGSCMNFWIPFNRFAKQSQCTLTFDYDCLLTGSFITSFFIIVTSSNLYFQGLLGSLSSLWVIVFCFWIKLSSILFSKRTHMPLVPNILKLFQNPQVGSSHLVYKEVLNNKPTFPNCKNKGQEWSHVRRTLSAHENTPREQEGESLQNLQNPGLSLDCVFMALWVWQMRVCFHPTPGVVDKSVFSCSSKCGR